MSETLSYLEVREAKRRLARLEEEIVSLPVKDRIDIMIKLRTSMDLDGFVPAEEMMEHLARRMKTQTGTDVKERGHGADLIWRRAMFVHCARGNGFTLQKIADFLGMTHASVLNAERKMKSALELPGAFKDIVEQYTKYLSTS